MTNPGVNLTRYIPCALRSNMLYFLLEGKKFDSLFRASIEMQLVQRFVLCWTPVLEMGSDTKDLVGSPIKCCIPPGHSSMTTLAKHGSAVPLDRL